MANHEPTLKIRLDMSNSKVAWLGRTCDAAAAEIIGPREDIEVIDAKWGRPVQQWHDTGGGWGRPRLSGYQKGYITAVRQMTGDSDFRINGLLEIIDNLLGKQTPK